MIVEPACTSVKCFEVYVGVRSLKASWKSSFGGKIFCCYFVITAAFTPSGSGVTWEIGVCLGL